MISSKTYIATPPGATIKEQLEDRNMTQKEFAKRMDMSEKHISRLINGEVSLTPELSVRLEMVLGIPAGFWNNLESIYREKLAKVKAENEMDDDLELLKKIPYKHMADNSWVENTNNRTERVVNTRKFFEVSNLALINKPMIRKIACRRLGDGETSDYALLAWAQEAKLQARNIDTAPVNIQKLVNNLPEIRRMTRKDPSEFNDNLHEILAECGIALVLLPHIDGSYLHGATFYDGKKIVMGLTTRGRDADKFWFSLFHELGHIILGHIGNDEITDDDEKAANEFAANKLIPLDEFEKFTSEKDFSIESITKFSDRIEIDQGIVIGRLQKEYYIPFNQFGSYKTKYNIQV